MTRAEKILQEITGKPPKPYMRMPFGARNPRVLKIVGDLGYRSIFWSLDSADWREGWTAPMVQERVIEMTGNGFIVVHHSSPAATADSLDAIIKALKQKGFQLVTVSALLAQQGGASIQATTPGYEPDDLQDLASQGIPTLYRGLQLRAVAVPSLARLMAAAKADGVDLTVLSAYRSYQEQQAVYQREVAASGQAKADRVVARAGHSQHQLGTAVDFTARSVSMDLAEAFGETAEGRWLAANAHRFGWVISYPKGKEHITGYAYEPWHYRYLGESAAADIALRGVTMEEYLSARR
jgi:LAS superfamily LD-carboxypeptidase LdcB